MIIIGEKLNGSIPAVADAIARRDADFIHARARAQAEAGASYIDVCASVGAENELATLQWMIGLVEDVTDTPICLDSPDPAALVAAMSFCSRPGMINSVSLEGGKIDTVFPAIRDTDWRCVALLCDDSGIPASAEQRLAVLEGVMRRAAEYGIEPTRLFIDPLVMTLSADAAALSTFAACASEIKRRYPAVHITSGLSNISYGLPARKCINQAFMVLAMQAGMDSAIADPTNRDLRGIIYAADALLGRDAYCLQYIAAAERGFPTLRMGADAPDEAESRGGDARAESLLAIRAAVGAGQADAIGELVDAALFANVDPGDILNEGMIAAMTDIGERFSRGEAFIPEMLVAARTMQKGMERLKPVLAADAAGSNGKVIIGTVAGDLHDIGKNLVALMIESAGFAVIDLGVDVSAERFIAAINEDPDVKIVALSTLLTTTMPAMQQIVGALNAIEDRSFRILVGGAPVTEAFAKEIGADAYSADAAAAAVMARKLLS